MSLLADYRESSDVIAELRKRGIKVEVKKLPVGDYLFSDVAVERKTVSDLYFSLKTWRLWDELINLKNNYPRPVLIIEGVIPEPYHKADLRKINTIYNGLITNAVGKLRIPVIPTLNSKVTARIISLMYARSSREKTEYLRPVRKQSISPEDIKSDILCCLPGISRKKAKKILDKFKTIQRFVNATPEEIAEIRGISSAGAERIIKILTE